MEKENSEFICKESEEELTCGDECGAPCPVPKPDEEKADSSEREWQLFLDNMHVESEKELLRRIDFKLRKEIVDNEHFVKAKEGADGDLKERIDKFVDALESGEVWFERFLSSLDFRNEKDLLASGDGSKLARCETNEFYVEAKRLAKGETKERIGKFERALSGFEVWYKCFLNTYKASDWQSLLKEVDSISLLKEINDDVCLDKALTYMTDEEKSRYKIENFLDEMQTRIHHYELAQKSWKDMIKDLGCAREFELRDICIRVETDKYFKQALEHAEASKDEKLINHIRGFGSSQRDNVNKNIKRRNRKRTLLAVTAARLSFIIITLVLSLFASTSIILAFAGISYFKNFWYIWALSIGASDTAVIITFLSLALALSLAVAALQVRSLILFRRPFKLRLSFVIFTTLALLCYALLISGVYFNATPSGRKNLPADDAYVLEFVMTERANADELSE